MDQFSYLSVLLSIIVGLAITQVLKGFRGMLLARSRIVMYWPTVVWAFWLIPANVQSWWSMFTLRDIETWSFVAFGVILLQTVFQYMLAAIVLPDFFGEEPVDLRTHYWNHVNWFFGLWIAVLCTSLSKDLVLSGHLPDSVNLSFHIGFMALSIAALLIRRDWFHKCLALVSPGIFMAYTILLFSNLR